MQDHTEHFGGGHAVFALIAKARHNARLIVITPEQRIPRLIVHPLLPVAEQGFERYEIGQRQRPFFAVRVIHL
ncbi:hypothetical protein D3C87_1951920 [compost metagenome]